MKTQNAEFQRELIHENEELFLKIIGQLPQYIPLLNELRDKYQSLEIGDFSDEVFKELITSGTASIESRYIILLNEEMDKIGVKKALIRDNMTKESSKLIEVLKTSLAKLKQFRPRVTRIIENIPDLSIGSITYGNRSQIFYIADEEGEIIMETYCRTYIENQMEKDGYGALCKLAEGYAEFLEVTKDIRDLRFKGFYSLGRLISDPPSASENHPIHNEKPMVNKAAAKSFLSFNPNLPRDRKLTN